MPRRRKCISLHLAAGAPGVNLTAFSTANEDMWRLTFFVFVPVHRINFIRCRMPVLRQNWRIYMEDVVKLNSGIGY